MPAIVRMEVKCSHISVGALHYADRSSTEPPCVVIGEAHFAFKLGLNEIGPALKIHIEKEEVGTIEACLSAPSQFIALTLTKKGCRDLLKKSKGKFRAGGKTLEEAYTVDSQHEPWRRIFISMKTVPEDLQSNLLKTYKNKVIMMTMDQSTELLRRCYYHPRIAFLTDLHEIEVDIAQKKVTNPHITSYTWSQEEVFTIKKITSFIYYFKVLKGTKKSLKGKMNQIKNKSIKYNDFISEIFWSHEMFTEQMEGYGKKLKCDSSDCKEVTVLKCASCGERRYCSVGCQETDFTSGHSDICQELKARKEQERMSMDKRVEEVYVNPEGVTFTYFMDKLDQRANHEFRQILHSHLGRKKEEPEISIFVVQL